MVVGSAAFSGAAFAQPKAAGTPATSSTGAAPTAADFAPGALVRDSNGVQVATVVSADANQVELDTGQTKIRFPANLITKNAQGLALTITADQFKAALAKAHARSEAAKAQAQTPSDAKPQ